MTKAEWRREFRQRLKLWSSHSEKNFALQSLILRLQDFLRVQQGTWGLFMAHQEEPNLKALLGQRTGPEWAFPVIAGSLLEWWIPGPLGFSEGSFGLQEPLRNGARKLASVELNGFLVPGLGFDLNGNRLGRGRGYYDRALSVCTSALKVGVGFECQLVNELPQEPFDVKMDWVITQDQTRKCG